MQWVLISADNRHLPDCLRWSHCLVCGQPGSPGKPHPHSQGGTTVVTLWLWLWAYLSHRRWDRQDFLACLAFGRRYKRRWWRFQIKNKRITPINTQVGRQNTGVKKKIAEWAKAAALKHNQERMAGRKVWDAKIKTSLYFAWISKDSGFYQNLQSQGGGASYWLARRLILARVHEALGLDRAAHPVTGGFYSSAAPLSTQVWFPLLDIFWHESWRSLIMKLLNSNKNI